MEGKKPLVRVCCVCYKTNLKEQWGYHPEHLKAIKEEKVSLTHGYCTDCHGQAMNAVDKIKTLIKG